MNPDILHVLNGTSTLHGFEQTGLDGDTMVWHEVFSEGPLEEDITSAISGRIALNGFAKLLAKNCMSTIARLRNH